MKRSSGDKLRSSEWCLNKIRSNFTNLDLKRGEEVWGGGCWSWRVIVGKKDKHASVLTWESVSNSAGMDFQHSSVDHISLSPYLLYGGDFASSPHPYPLHGKDWCSIMSSTTEVCLPFGYSSFPYSLCTITNLASRPNLYLFTSTSISLLPMTLSHYIIYLSSPTSTLNLPSHLWTLVHLWLCSHHSHFDTWSASIWMDWGMHETFTFL